MKLVNSRKHKDLINIENNIYCKHFFRSFAKFPMGGRITVNKTCCVFLISPGQKDIALKVVPALCNETNEPQEF